MLSKCDRLLLNARVRRYMQTRSNLKSIIKTKQETHLAILRMDLSHTTTKGDHCECAWIKYLKSFLPKRYEVDKGMVYDSDGNISEQIDIIVYDPFYTPLIVTTASGDKIVAAESVYAVFECKPKISTSNLRYASKKIASVTNLNRKSTYVIDNGEKRHGRKPTAIIGGILATESSSTTTVISNVKQFTNIDIGYAPDSICFFSKRITCNSNEIIIKNSNNAGDLFFWGLLEDLHAIGTVAPIDNLAYAEFLIGKNPFGGDYGKTI